jgi:hypothetical protein
MRAEVLWQHHKIEADIRLLGEALGKSFSDIPDMPATGCCAMGSSVFEYFSGGEGAGIVESWIETLVNAGVRPTTNRGIERA